MIQSCSVLVVEIYIPILIILPCVVCDVLLLVLSSFCRSLLARQLMKELWRRYRKTCIGRFQNMKCSSRHWDMGKWCTGDLLLYEMVFLFYADKVN